MVRLTDLPDYEREHLQAKNLDPLGPAAWVVKQKPLEQMRVALITTAGLHFKGERVFDFADASFRPIPIDEDANTLIMSHSSVNFDRSGFQQDVNTVFPIDRFKELAKNGTIAELAAIHYSFMGAGLLPEFYESTVRTLAGFLKKDNVDAVFLTPV